MVRDLSDRVLQCDCKWCLCCVRMDDDSSLMKSVRIVPVNNCRSCLDSSDNKSGPGHVKVCFNTYLCCLPV